MRGQGRARSVLVGVMGVILTTCLYAGPLPRPANPPEGFRGKDVIGVWRADYGAYDWRVCGPIERMRGARRLEEWLVLKEDGTFYQVLRDRQGGKLDQKVEGTWHIERLPDGVTRLHLENGRFFAGEVCRFYPKLMRIGGYYSSDQTGHELIFNQGKVVLIIGWGRFSNNPYLEYPFVGNPDAPIIVRFERVSEMDLNVIPTPSP